MKKNYRSEKEQPQIAVKFANTIFVLGILFSILLMAYAIYKIYNPPEIADSTVNQLSPAFYIISMICGGVFAALFGLGLKRLSNNLKVNLSVLFCTIGIAVYGIETYLELSNKTSRKVVEEPGYLTEDQRVIIAKKIGVPYDTRSHLEVLDDLIDSGVEAYPSVGSGQHQTDNDVILNLGGISNITTLLRNEAGYYPIIETDEHGFNNPKGLYIENNVDIVLTGDSFTEGYSVHSNETISAVLRQLGYNAISVGKAGNGPLIELAALKEYAEPLKPQIVLWLYSANNDLYDLEHELQSPILRKYLNEDDYSQNLISRQKEIDDVLINYVQVAWEKEKGNVRKSENGIVWKRMTNLLTKLLKLSKLREMINLTPILTPIPTTSKPIFIDILQESKQIVSDWDGKMYLVYLPYYGKYLTGKGGANRDFVMQTANELNIPIIDIHREVFDPHPDPLSLFPFRMLAHYNAQGYHLIAEAIGKRLEADGYEPIKLMK